MNPIIPASTLLCSLALFLVGCSKRPEFVAIEQGAKNGNAADQYRLAWNYRVGNDVKSDEDKAMDWLIKSAEQDFLRAQITLGYVYLDGNGADRNPKKAYQWFRRAAEQNSAQGECQVGRMYMNGNGIEKNYEEAMSWFLKAGRKGNLLAFFYLGKMHEDSLGVEKNLIEAYKFYILAERGDAIKRLAAILSPDEVRDAITSAVNFQ